MTGPYLEGKATFALQMHQLTGPDDAVKTVNYWIDEGVDNFKAYMFITKAELGAAIQAAHKRRVKVTGHLCSVNFREAADLGIDDWSTDFLRYGIYGGEEGGAVSGLWRGSGGDGEAGCEGRAAA